MDKPKEKELIKQAQKDPEAFGVIFDMYYEPIFNYVLRRVGKVQASQDIVSETFFKALNKLWQFKWRNISISSWLYRIAGNEVNQYFRKMKRSTHSLEIMIEENAFDPKDEIDILEEILEQEREIALHAKWQEVSKLIQKLPEKYQEVLALRFFEDRKISEIAEILGKKEGTIKSLLSRAMSKLKESL
jgi:RNA polymerase sigma-70 factor, ECF subfamily